MKTIETTVIVAAIGLIGTLGAAVVSNWDKICGSSSKISVTESAEKLYYIIGWSVQTVEEAKDKVNEAKRLGYGKAYYLLKDGSKAIAVVLQDNVPESNKTFAVSAARNAGVPGDTYAWPMDYVSGQ